MFEEREQYAPLVIIEYDDSPGTFCLMLTDDHMIQVNDTFEANGRYGNGYGWADVTLQAIASSAPDLSEQVNIDAEAGGLYIQSTDLDALKQLATILHQAFHDKTILGPLVANAPYEFD